MYAFYGLPSPSASAIGAVRLAVIHRVELLGLASLRRYPAPSLVPVPEVLQEYVIESAQAADYDGLLQGGRHE